ncbi:autotransporter outer membrane beta-barrel domain-containing protein (plasmid) [Tistrella mobilis]|uniref:hypothetical protein n=1 Tax=Tistrella mobilis TaxID=171437 RepID=UPI003558268C
MAKSGSFLYRGNMTAIGAVLGLGVCGALITAGPARAENAEVSTGPAYYYVNQQPSPGTGSKGSNASFNGFSCDKPDSGGQGPTGTAVTATVTPDISTTTAYGGTLVIAGSTGGTGGTGGSDKTGVCGNGRGGGTGGTGGAVTVTLNGTSSATYPIANTTVVAYSQGGTGGTGGNTNDPGAHGGDGGSGGAGGAVTVTNNMALNIQGGSSSLGIVAQSAGGQGGDGGNNNGGLWGDGGDGVPGGAGGNVTITNNAAITTAAGTPLAAQSIGGFGGDGGSSNGTFGGYSGGGGYGGNAGLVTINNIGVLTVGSAANPSAAAGATAIYAQSVGGGGGNAGVAAGLVALGADGGRAGSGSLVTVNNSSTITAYGPSSVGIFAQSVGGAGGSGGMAFSASGSTASVAVGGSGGDGGSGGSVAVNNTADICTGNGCIPSLATTPVTTDSAGGAVGVLAQSVGGGGGVGGMGLSGSGSGLAFAVGGSGGGGGSAGSVAVLSTGSITTVEVNSAGILAQSVGGGGGVGGGAVALSASSGQSASLSHGGSGGDGGSAGSVAINCNSFSGDSSAAGACSGQGRLSGLTTGKTISTVGDGSSAIAGQSIGGGGGSGGYAVSLAAGFQGSFALSYGGKGGKGGNGGQVYVSPNGITLTTTGVGASALVGQSIGGGGGGGGSTVDASLAVANSALSFGVGGSGGAAGAGSTVIVENTGSVITTSGNSSHGILAQSIGGGGGSGGSALGLSASPQLAVSLGVGGSGGAGGAAGAVTAHNYAANSSQTAAITTYGYGASAILAQSIGGGGGNGGYTTSGALSYSSGASAAIGGAGGSGNNGGTVQVVNTGLINTYGGGAAAIAAQSIGGGGGSGGYAVAGSISGSVSANIGAGGSGASGGAGGAVTLVNQAAVTVSAASTGNAPALLAQSIGGGGGSGGFSGAAGLSSNGTASMAVGGGGGNGGTGGTVTVDNYSALTVTGPLSPGVVAQSMGGNGGSGGFAIAGSFGESGAVSAAIGGGGGKGGRASQVTVTIQGGGRVSTTGHQSAGILAQSIGGAGGNGGWDIAGSLGGLGSAGVSLGGSGGGGGAAGGVTIATYDTITTTGLLSHGIVAQSIGGSGGLGGFSAGAAGSTIAAPAVAVGGYGGSGGTGGTVTVNTYTGISTAGDLAAAIIAQSIGGTGGSGGAAYSGSVSTGNPASKISVGAAGATGGSGGSGQNGGAVSVTVANNLVTSGFDAYGIIAQSIGGGGGNGGNASAFAASASGGGEQSKSGSASVAIGGSGAAGGNAGAVAVTLTGSIQTGTAGVAPGNPGAGDRSVAILAQSVGGSGGNGGSAYANAISGTGAISVAVGGGGGTGGTGGRVTVCGNVSSGSCSNPWGGVTATGGSILTYGNHASAIYAQSVGGGGGRGGYSESSASSNKYAASLAVGGFGGGGGNADAVTVVAGGTLATTGAGSTAIFAQSVGGGGGDGGTATASATGQQGGALDGGVAAYTGTGFAQQTNTGAAVATAAQFSQSGPAASTDEEADNGVGASLAIGGAGGKAGNGGAVLVSSVATITTSGMLSNGITAQSVGGGGGNGGSATTNAAGGNYAGSISLGGTGGGGGAGSTATVVNTGSITTSGLQSAAIFAQSVGGGGGNGGAASSTVESGGSGALSFGLGGSGGGGGAANLVTVLNFGTLRTTGINSAGIFAQSVGGGGGNGGGATTAATAAPASDEDEEDGSTSASTGTVPTSGSGQSNSSHNSASAGKTGSTSQGSQAGADGGYAAGLAIGGSGGGGAAGGSIVVTNSASITTGTSDGKGGLNSQAIFAQSVGGGGGNGGSASSNADAGKASVALSMGGTGGGAGAGGAVNVGLGGGTLTTYGANAAAVYAQSVGGGGGNGGSASSTTGSGGSASVALGLGGSGAGGGAGGSVNVCGSISNNICNNDQAHPTSITTWGDLSYGIYVQSVGGGGGNGGAVTTSATAGQADDSEPGASVSSGSTGTSASTSKGVAMSAGLGGSGGGGGSGGTVSVNSATTIQTAGAHATAIYAQSVGGGGGTGASATTNANSGAYATSFALGGSGGNGGAGGAVYVVNDGTLATYGFLSHGIFAQSVGGGGGDAGGASSTSAQGGEASLAMALGGSGGGGQNGQGVTVTSRGVITTAAGAAHAIVAQSVGGGGGLGGSAQSSASGGKISAPVTLGGGGGISGSGGTVSVYITRDITASGIGSGAVIAQSIGGGGGISDIIDITSATRASASASLTLGSSSSNAGDGGKILVSTGGGTSALIQTGGDNASALVVQSIGGGGGIATFSAGKISGAVSPTFTLGASRGGGSGGTSAADAVMLTLGDNGGTTSIETWGRNSMGVAVQSIGSGGGIAGFATTSAGSTTATAQLGQSGGGGNGRAVTLSGTASIITHADNAIGAVVQSVTGGGGVALAAAGSGAIFSGSTRLGATGGGTGDGGTVNVNLTGGRIVTNGFNAHGLVAQSIAGGGGISGIRTTSLTLGGVVAGYGNMVTVASSSAITTYGTSASGIIAQSIGGGGGIATSDGQVNFAGAPSASNSRQVLVTTTGAGAVQTQGATSFGILAQSIGGGGGAVFGPNRLLGANFGASIAYADNVGIDTGANVITTGMASVAVLGQSIGGGGGVVASTASDAGFTSYAVGLNGANASGLNAGTMSITTRNQTIATAGANAAAVVGQSIGAGGTFFSQANTASQGAVSVTAYLGTAYGSGNGGVDQADAIRIALGTGGVTTIDTSGANAFGAVAQAVGGGGGIIAISNQATGGTVGTAILGQRGGSGSGMATTLTGTANIVTRGTNALGAVAQSISNGGGILAVSGQSGAAFTGNVTLGATAGGGSNGRTVTVNLTNGSIATGGAYAHGLVAQSIAGGGGISGLLTNDVKFGGVVAGNGGAVSVTSSSAITTYGTAAAGIVAQSIGGGGGLAIGTGAVTFANTPSGSNASQVTVTTSGGGAVQTQGATSFGILAQSVGGGGGAIFGPTSLLSTNLGTGIGYAGNIAVDAGANVVTSGAGSVAILGQSIGGGGGVIASTTSNAGFVNYGTGLNSAGNGNLNAGTVAVTTRNQTIATAGANAAAVVGQAVGASGVFFTQANSASQGAVNVTGYLGTVSAGGNGGADVADAIKVTLGAGGLTTIDTSGANAFGAIAQSVGGGGGIVAIATQATGGTVKGAILGQRGGSGTGLATTLTGTANIVTRGTNALGVVAQSISTGGGIFVVSGQSGAAFTGNVRLGATGGSGSNTRAVNVNLSGGSIATGGAYAHGLVAQSIAGGGGISGVLTNDVTLGGVLAGNGGAVSVASSSAITTYGTAAAGIVAQSIGGGGGLAIGTGAVTFANAPSGSNASQVTVTTTGGGAVQTQGTTSFGILAQSIGGAGGAIFGPTAPLSTNLGTGIGYAGNIAVDAGANVVTSGIGSVAILGQSIGGGGGVIASTTTNDGFVNYGTGLNSAGNGNLNAGTVAITTRNQTIATSGVNAAAVVGQSVGAGGVYFTQANTVSQGTINVTGYLGTVSAGGNGGANVADAIKVTLGAGGVTTIDTSGANAFGAVAQSVGGGGGIVAISTRANYGNVKGVQLGQRGGNGMGMATTVTGAASIVTRGNNAFGIVAQSVSNGGGILAVATPGLEFFTGTAVLGARGGSGNNAGNATVNLSGGGGITTTGVFAHGIVAQSIAGGGGISALNTDTVQMGGGTAGIAGVASVTALAPVATSGIGASAIVAQSIGGGGGLALTSYNAQFISTTGGSDASTVGVTTTGNGWLQTTGNLGFGILAQSIGGGGGAFIAPNHGVIASFGASAAYAGGVYVDAGANVVTTGQGSTAILAQSVGGGGGVIASSFADAAYTSYVANIYGSSGGNDYGSNVAVTTHGQTIATAGANSAAVIAQSVGASGVYYAQTNTAAQGSIHATFNLGAGQGSGNGGVSQSDSVKVTLGSGGATTIDTSGANAFGVVAQSVGAGGGIYAIATQSTGGSIDSSRLGARGGGGVGLATTVTGAANITTRGTNALGVVAQSISGGGGIAVVAGQSGSTGYSGPVTLGTYAGGGGNGGVVNVNLTGGSITTGGVFAPGLVAQSIAAGGGISGVHSSGVYLGGYVAGNGNTVTVSSGAAIGTIGNASAGIVAQSIGGGGGLALANGGNAVILNAPSGSNASQVRVTTTGSGSVQTQGATAFGILAQSIGGAGGAVFSPVNQATASFGTGIAYGGSIVIDTAANVVTSGAGSAGIVGQSIGGGGGVIASAFSNANVTSYGVTLNAANASGLNGNTVAVTTRTQTIATAGANGAGVIAQSMGAGGTYFTQANAASQGAVHTAINLGTSVGKGDGGQNTTYSTNVTLGAGGVTTIDTSGANAYGVVGQSIGGGGGIVSIATLSSGGWIDAGIIGQRGGGGSAMPTSVNGTANIVTRGTNAAGVIVQSISGGGGVASLSSQSGAWFSGMVTLGATGGSGANANTAYGYLAAGSVTTSGAFAPGLVVQSIAGGGGIAGIHTDAVRLGGPLNGNGGTVSATSSALITTYGGASPGIVAQSIGGGGGLAHGAGQVYFNSAVSGSNAGNVWLTTGTGGTVQTVGSVSYGILAQSVGGAGGAVFSEYRQLAANFGSAIAYGSAVTLNVPTSVITNGVGSTAILAQSVGGGGGVVASVFTDAGVTNYGVGNMGGGGSNLNGGAVSITTQNQTIATTAANATAVVAQSVGDNGIFFTQTNTAAQSSASVNLQLGAVRGSGNGGPSQNDAVAGYLGNAVIQTSGANSLGVLVQSVGGGGGFASIATQASGGSINARLGQQGGAGSAQDITITGAPKVLTQGVNAAGVVAQAITGGGGVMAVSGTSGAVFSGSVYLGGTGGGTSGNAAVSLTLSGGSIQTGGSFAPGLVAQVISGGGGLSAINATSVNLGGTVASKSNTLTLTNGAAITTTGAASPGLVAQSIGGGGGLALAANGATVRLGNKASGADGNNVTITSNGQIYTTGVNSFGILAQSVGSGGGAVITTGGTVSAAANASSKASAGSVTVGVNAPITTTGAGAHGVVAQSAAGGGGIVTNGTTTLFLSGNGGGSSHAVSVYVYAPITVSGAGASAVVAHSTTDPVVEIAEGVVVTGAADGHALLLDGPINEVTNAGTLQTFAGGDGLVIDSRIGDTTVTNKGTLTGSIKLGDGGANLLTNEAGATINSGASIDLGGTGSFVNHGRLQQATEGVVTTTINGGFTQSEDGEVQLRVDHATGKADGLHITGAASMDGKLSLATINSGSVKPGRLAIADVLVSDTGLAAGNLELSAPASAILSYSLTNTDGRLGIQADADFTPEGLSGFGRRIGELLGRVQSEAASEYSKAITAGLVSISDTATLDRGYRSVGDTGAASVPQSMLTASTRAMQAVTGRLDSWRMGAAAAAPGSRDAALDAAAEASGGGGRAWMTPEGAYETGDGFDGHYFGTTIGIDGGADDGSFLVGGAFTYGETSYDLDGLAASGTGKQYGVSVYGLRRFGDAYASVIGYAATGNTRYTRDLRFLGLTRAAVTRFDGTTLGARLEVGYALPLTAGLKITPFAAVEPTRLHLDEARDSFSNGGGVVYEASDTISMPMTLGFQIGGPVTFEDGSRIEPFFRAGWKHEFRPDRDITRHLAELPGVSFQGSDIEVPEDAAVLRAGVQYRLDEDFDLQLSVDSELSEERQSVGGTLSLRYRW